MYKHHIWQWVYWLQFLYRLHSCHNLVSLHILFQSNKCLKESKLFCYMLWAQKYKDCFIAYQTRAILILQLSLHWKDISFLQLMLSQRDTNLGKGHHGPRKLLMGAVRCIWFWRHGRKMLRNQLVMQAANLRIRNRLLLEPDLTLNKAVTIAVQMETALKNSEILSDTSQVRAIQSHRNVKQPLRNRKTIPASSSERTVSNGVLVTVADPTTIWLTNLHFQRSKQYAIHVEK